jgi:hypothetical protein
VRNATLVGADNKKVPGSTGVKAVLDVTAVPGVDTVQLVLEHKDPVSGKYVQMLAAAPAPAFGTDTLTIYPGAAVAANVSLERHPARRLPLPGRALGGHQLHLFREAHRAVVMKIERIAVRHEARLDRRRVCEIRVGG